MIDLIKREDAIEELADYMYEIALLKADGRLDTMEHYLNRAKAMLKRIPSADRPQGWIPCSERQPEKAGHYLCSFKKPNFIDNIYVDLAYWTGGRWYGYSANAINAWMPLPEPWKGADDEH